jgi:hypothetical protein
MAECAAGFAAASANSSVSLDFALSIASGALKEAQYFDDDPRRRRGRNLPYA